MLSMGITLTPADFVAVASEPSSIIMQFALCYGMMPGLALLLGRAFGLDAGLLAGMVLVGSINGGQASNLCTYIAKGNVALSVLMTTATTVGAILMTPFLCKAMLGAVVPVDARGIAVSTCQVSSFIHPPPGDDVCVCVFWGVCWFSGGGGERDAVDTFPPSGCVLTLFSSY
jgi:BASS family bile acid:Na+ symporter